MLKWNFINTDNFLGEFLITVGASILLMYRLTFSVPYVLLILSVKAASLKRSAHLAQPSVGQRPITS